MINEPIATVRKLLIDDLCLPEAKVTPHARIMHDLGVDGDDAAEVFQKLNEQFGTDFTELNHQWQAFFNNEGVDSRAVFFGISAIIICGGATGVMVAALHWPKIIAIALALVLLVGGGRRYSRRFQRELHPLTVSGLAEIVRSGRWPADPADVR